jgi:phage shock protein A
MQRVLNAFFGRPADKAKAKVAALDVMPTLETLTSQERNMERKIQHLDTRMKTCVKDAENYLRNNDKFKALHILKQKALLEEQLKSSQTMLNLLIQQRMALETSQLQRDTLKAIETTNTYLKTSQDTLSTDKAETIMEEVQERMETQKEIHEILGQKLPGQQEAEDAAEKELEILMGKAVPTPIPNPLTSFPSAPVSSAVEPSSVDAELASLAAVSNELRVALPA